MISILASIRPIWCEKIFDGSKTLELRKTKPKANPPFKVYIYCANSMEKIISIGPYRLRGNGRVCAEFICDYILRHCETTNADVAEQQSLVRRENIYWYSGCGNHEIFGWHISQLKIYDEPRPLTNYHRPCPNSLRCESCAMHNEHPTPICGNYALEIRRPPQSWMYAEDQT